MNIRYRPQEWKWNLILHKTDKHSLINSNPRFPNIYDSYVKNSFHSPFDIWIMNISELEPEYLEFIKKQKYGTPKAFTKAHSYEELEAYFAG